jgi:hypothetical protein
LLLRRLWLSWPRPGCLGWRSGWYWRVGRR